MKDETPFKGLGRYVRKRNAGLALEPGAGPGPARDYVHPELNQPVTAIGGQYLLLSEKRMAYGDREVFYLMGTAVIDTSCCGAGGCFYALVPGFIDQWKYRADPAGRPVSRVIPIENPRVREEITSRISRIETVHQFNFL